jgi:hypothetical protein
MNMALTTRALFQGVVEVYFFTAGTCHIQRLDFVSLQRLGHDMLWDNILVYEVFGQGVDYL